MRMKFLISAVALLCLVAASPSQPREHRGVDGTYTNETGIRRSRLTAGTASKTLRFRVTGDAGSGRISFKLQGPGGGEPTIKGEFTAGAFELDTGDLTPCKGTWLLTVELQKFTGSCQTTWSLE
jgi:hypothetical protein